MQINKNSIGLVLPLLLMAVVFISERLFLSELIVDPQPRMEIPYLMRMLLIATLSFIFIRVIWGGQAGEEDKDTPLPIQWTKWGVLALGAGIVGLFIVDVTLFTRLQFEDFVVEYLSAGGMFFAAGLLLYAVILLGKTGIANKRRYQTLVLFLALTLFVVGMEEVSWFQRVAGFDTPEILSGNEQGEFNLHNLASNLSEEMYYMFGFVILVLFPFAYRFRRNWFNRNVAGIQWFIPGEAVLFAGVLMAAYNYNLWNRASIQWAFFCTLFILLYLLSDTLTSKFSQSSKISLLLLTILFVFTQVIFLVRGETFLIEWSVTEYKELLIPLGFVIYSVSLVLKLRPKAGSAETLIAESPHI